MQRLQVGVSAQPLKSGIVIGRRILSAVGKETRHSLGNRAQRLALISNQKVFKLYGSPVVESLRASGFQVSYWLMGDGERYKSLKTAEAALRFFNDHSIERTDGVVSLGGGVTGDLAGFAAAIYLRGISFVQIPTTLTAQIDASIGGKVAVNLPSGKNRAGAFHQPRVVIADLETLKTLPSRELTAGWCECIKQGAIGSRKLFNQTTAYLSATKSVRMIVNSQLESIVAAHAAFKSAIVKSDLRESPDRTDSHSRRVLNFGHTIGHALEQVTGYRRFRHGEAVGWGMLCAGELSKTLGLLDQSELELLQAGIGLCGSLPSAKDLDVDAIIKAATSDKKSTSGHVQWVLLERIGRPRIVSGREIDVVDLNASLRTVLKSRNQE